MPDMLADHAKPGTVDASWTRREILQQPETLRATQALLLAQQARIGAFLSPLLQRPGLRVVLAGAGSSSYIGECLAPHLSALLRRPVEAVATTDLVSAPHLYLDARPLLLVSFGRSGNSPESLAAIEIADAAGAETAHLIITCNADGALARLAAADAAAARHCAVILPDATHDRGFAMTSSFSAMLYAALTVFTGPAGMQDRADRLAAATEITLAGAAPRMEALAAAGYERVAYLGSGVLHGLAREAALKMLELTNGAVVTLAGTTMGFRHGPKTILTARSLAVIFVSNHALTRRYDLDLAAELRQDGRCGAVLEIGAGTGLGAGAIGALTLPGMAGAEDADLLFPALIPAQCLALEMSLRLGLTPDLPDATGTVNRVVQGVRLHRAGA